MICHPHAKGILVILAALVIASCNEAPVRLGVISSTEGPDNTSTTKSIVPNQPIQVSPGAVQILASVQSADTYGFKCYPYRVWDLGEVESANFANAINDQGDAVAHMEMISPGFGANTHASIHYRSRREHRHFDCEVRNSNATADPVPLGVNNGGEVVGSIRNIGLLTHHAFYWDGLNKIQSLFPVDVESEAVAINDSGMVVGNIQHPFGIYYDEVLDKTVWYEPTQGFYRQGPDPEPTPIENMQGAWEYASNSAHDINTAGIIAGEAQDENDWHKPISWNINTGYTIFPTLGGNEGRALCINDFGDMAGQSEDMDAVLKPTLWSDGEVIDLGLLDQPYPFSAGRATGINSNLEVVGWDETDNSATNARAWVWREGVKQDLNELISPKLDLYIEEVYDINDSGEIAGLAQWQGGDRGVILIPQSCDEYGGAQ